MKTKLTARGGTNGWRVFRDRTLVSTHATEREASEAARNVKAGNPKSRVYYDHDYSVDCEIVD